MKDGAPPDVECISVRLSWNDRTLCYHGNPIVYNVPSFVYSMPVDTK
jgi:hypothetical protein